MRVQAVACALCLILPSTAAAQGGELTSLGWMSGCWELSRGTRTTLEMWMPPAGGLMLGASRTVVNGVTREHEYLRLRWEEGRPVYHAIPSGQSPTSFPAVFVSDTAVVFENLAHDFPQRIRYRRVGADSLVARIEGPGDGGPRGIDFPMRRASCMTP